MSMKMTTIGALMGHLPEAAQSRLMDQLNEAAAAGQLLGPDLPRDLKRTLEPHRADLEKRGIDAGWFAYALVYAASHAADAGKGAARE